MRFVLDQDVDEEVGVRLRKLGHDAWSVGQAKRARALDADQVVYAHDKDAVFITHDRELIASRKAMPIGQYLSMHCSEWDAADLIERHQPTIRAVLEHSPDVIIEVYPGNVNLIFGTEPG